MKSSEVDRFLVRKLKLELKNGRKHDDYRLRLAGGEIPLPMLLTVSRGSGEITSRNLKGLASNVGMTVGGFRDSARCQIGRECVLMCLAFRLLEKASEMVERTTQDPLVYGEFSQRLSESVALILDEIESHRTNADEWTTREEKELARTAKRFVGEVGEALGPALDRWQTIAGVRQEIDQANRTQ